MEIDERISTYFEGRIKQVFVYLTGRCQLQCRQCLYKPLLTSSHDDMSFDLLVKLLSIFRRYGAFKLSFLGGEPSLYCDLDAGKGFPEIVAVGKSLGYSLVRADTNGQFGEDFLLKDGVRKLDELTFSLDGCSAEIHDKIRGKEGTFQKCITRINQAVNLGYRVQITSCIHKEVCNNADEGIKQIENMIQLCDLLGVHSLNFHPILKVGVARDNWIDDTEINPLVWLEIYQKMMERLKVMNHQVEVRLPMRYVEEQLFTENHSYCPLRIGERVLIMPNGDLKICAFNIGTPFCFGHFSDKEIRYETNYNEYEKMKKCTIGCCNQISPNGLKALCMSYKPNQNEVVWRSLKEEGVV